MKNLLKSLISLFLPRYHLYDPRHFIDPQTGKETPALVGSFYTRSAYNKAKADLERKHRIERAKQNGTFFRIEAEPWYLDDVRRFIYNIQDAEIISTNGCRTEYISPRRQFVQVKYDGYTPEGESKVRIQLLQLVAPEPCAKPKIPSETPAPSNP